jgi:quercetin dioxygenase-like cupin family protein
VRIKLSRSSTASSGWAGDLVHAPPGEEHWHGVAIDRAVTHLAVNLGNTEGLEETEPSPAR